MADKFYSCSINNGMLYLPEEAVTELIGEQLEGEVFVTLHPENFISIYSKEYWDYIKSNLSQSPSVSPEYRFLQRTIIGHASKVVIKKYGLIIIPYSLLEAVEFDNVTEIFVHVFEGKVQLKLK